VREKLHVLSFPMNTFLYTQGGASLRSPSRTLQVQSVRRVEDGAEVRTTALEKRRRAQGRFQL
jgi:hypothetical protein